MALRYGTFSVNGQPLFSYLPCPRRVISPLTIPRDVLNDLETLLFGSKEQIGLSYDQTTTDKVGEKAYVQRATLCITPYVETSPHHYAPDPSREVTVEWEGVQDFAK